MRNFILDVKSSQHSSNVLMPNMFLNDDELINVKEVNWLIRSVFTLDPCWSIDPIMFYVQKWFENADRNIFLH